MSRPFIYIKIFSLLLLFSCGENKNKIILNRDQTLVSILKDSLNIEKTYSNIFVLTEDGCMACNKSFSVFMQNNYNENNLYLLAASGLIVDMSPFLDKVSKKEMIEMPINYIQKHKILDGSGLIRMKGNKIDTIIRLNAENLSDQLVYLEQVK
jgi:hypothetical protein